MNEHKREYDRVDDALMLSGTCHTDVGPEAAAAEMPVSATEGDAERSRGLLPILARALSALSV
jgi:hypothetical protein